MKGQSIWRIVTASCIVSLQVRISNTFTQYHRIAHLQTDSSLFCVILQACDNMTSQPLDTSTKTKWNYTFQWTEHHLPREVTDPLRQEYDKLGAAALERLQFHISRTRKDAASLENGFNSSQTDLYQVLIDNYKNDEILSEFWKETNFVPEWVDWEQIERGQKFFYRYAVANIMGFAFQGFVGENSVGLFYS